MISKDFRERVRENFFCGELAEVSNLILIGFILHILTINSYNFIFIVLTTLI